MPDLLLTPAPHDDAAAFLRGKPTLARDAFDQLVPDLRARAFTITGVECANAVQAVRDRIAEIPLGADWDKVKQEIADKISPWLDQPESKTDVAKAGEQPPSVRRAELLLRTHGFQAYAAAQFEVMDRQRAVFPYWQYQTADDDRVRSEHAALDGIVLPADSEFWQNHFPPWDWGCRCQVVPLMREDVADIERADAGKKPEARRVIDGSRQRELETTGMLTRALPGSNGLPQRFDMRAPDQRGRSFTFKPSTLKMDAAQLRERYDAQTWGSFERWAGQQRIEDGRTVLEWLNRKPANPNRPPPLPVQKPPPVNKPAAPVAPPAPPAAVPLPPAKATPATIPPPAPIAVPSPAATLPPPKPAPAKPGPVAPVSAALDIRVAGPQKAEVRTGINAVDRVHDDGDLPPIPIIGRTGGALGVYSFRRDGGADFIGVANMPTHWPALTTVHEIGHFLDHQVFGIRGALASVAHPAMQGFRDAVQATQGVAILRKMSPAVAREFLKPYELWARAYAQYIARKSGDPVLLAQLNKARKAQPWRQWSDEDFAPVEKAIDELLKSKGWLK